MLECDDIRWRRGPDFELRLGSIALPPGARVVVVGPSGGGKSSLIRALLGLEPQAFVRGLRWQGRQLDQAAPHERPFSWMAQDLGLWPHMSAAEQVAFARMRGRGARANEDDKNLLMRVGLGQRLDHRPAALSGGERQRLALARAISMARPWLLLDEPFSQVDPVLAQALGDDVDRLVRERGLGLIEVSHQVRRIDRERDIVWVIEDGRLVQSGRWHELAHAQATPWTRSFVALSSH